ncbi:MAG: hypothetical protein LBK41_03975 [Clostridiales bacterium]|jgi:hypothetical protein|nr:hypothetical protein [Clostridiales bacterium]
MINLIIDGIIAALLDAFLNTAVYMDQVKWGLNPPCFIVNCVNPANQLFVGTKYKRDNLFSVQYFPVSKTGAKAECYAVCDSLYQALEIIGVQGDLLRGTGAL